MIVGPEKKNSRFGSIVNSLLVLLYKVHFEFGIKPRHFSDRLIGSYDSQRYCTILGRQILINHFNKLFIQKASKMRIVQHYHVFNVDNITRNKEKNIIFL